MCGLQPFWADQWSNLHPSYQSYRTYLIMDSMRGDPAIEPFQSESDRSWVWNRPNINPSYQSYRTYLIMDSARGDPAIEPFFSRSQIDLIVWAWEAAAMIPGFATRLDGSSTAMSKPPRLSSSTTTPKAFSSTKTWEANYRAAMGANYRAGRSLEVVGEESMEVGKANPNPCAKYELAFGL